MVRKAAGEYSKTKEEQLSQSAKVAFDWFSTRYGAFTIYSSKKIFISALIFVSTKLQIQQYPHHG